MVKIKPFKGIRPPANLAKEVASRPYDVLNSVEAKAEAGEKSLLHIIKPEIDFDPIIDEHSTEAYDRADIVVFLTAHDQFKTLPYREDKVILDFCGIFKK